MIIVMIIVKTYNFTKDVIDGRYYRPSLLLLLKKISGTVLLYAKLKVLFYPIPASFRIKTTDLASKGSNNQ